MKKYNKLFGFFCCMIYFTSYISRINFGAVIAEIIASEGYAKSAISVVVTMSSISYGIGQPISGLLGDRLPPRTLICAGLIVTGACNLLIPFCPSVTLMSAVWFVNGFAQAFMWPPLVKLMSMYLEGGDFTAASANVTTASSLGTIFIYVASPLFIRISGWKAVFLFTGLTAAVVAVIWNVFLPKITAHIRKSPAVTREKNTDVMTEKEPRDGIGIREIFRIYGLVFICIAIMLQGALRDGITTWMPSCLSEVFKMETSVSILISVVLPIFAVFSVQISAAIQRNFVHNEVKLASFMFIMCAVCQAAWGLLYSRSVILSVLLPAITVALIHGINLMLICIVPQRFANCGHISLLSGLLNACTYVGSAVSTYGIAKISEIAGWQATIFVWCAIAVLGVVMCAVCIPKFRVSRSRLW